MLCCISGASGPLIYTGPARCPVVRTLLIRGLISRRGEATLELDVLGSEGARLVTTVLLDTGFNGFLTLPKETIRSLRLPHLGIGEAFLADGSAISVSIFSAEVRWHKSDIRVFVAQAEGAPLAGMALLDGSRVTMNVIENGEVTIEPLV